MSSKSKARKSWRCDVCQIAVFDTYDEALDHEQSCQGNTEADIDKLASAVARGGEFCTPAISGGSAVKSRRQRGGSEGMDDIFRAVTGRSSSNNTSSKNNTSNDGGLLMNGAGSSPTVSTPTVLALLASSRANNSGGVASNINNENGASNYAADVTGSSNPAIIVPDVSQAAAVAAASKHVLLRKTTQQQTSTVTEASAASMQKAQNENTQQLTPANNISDQQQTLENDKEADDSSYKCMKKKSTKWRCDYCPAMFFVYDDAVIHEATCKIGKTPWKSKTNTQNKNDTTANSINEVSSSKQPPNNTSNNKSNWKCDYCPATFFEYDDAVTHELECKKGKTPLTTTSGTTQNNIINNNSSDTNNKNNNSSINNDDNKSNNDIYPKKKVISWKCDYCPKTYPTYEEALEHENDCNVRGGVPATICIPKKVVPTDEEEEEDANGDDDGNNAVSSPLLPPHPPSTDKTNSNANKRVRWKCDICLQAVFDTYEEALEHENQCKGVIDGGELKGREIKKSKAEEKENVGREEGDKGKEQRDVLNVQGKVREDPPRIEAKRDLPIESETKADDSVGMEGADNITSDDEEKEDIAQPNAKKRRVDINDNVYDEYVPEQEAKNEAEKEKSTETNLEDESEEPISTTPELPSADVAEEDEKESEKEANDELDNGVYNVPEKDNDDNDMGGPDVSDTFAQNEEVERENQMEANEYQATEVAVEARVSEVAVEATTEAAEDKLEEDNTHEAVDDAVDQTLEILPNVSRPVVTEVEKSVEIAAVDTEDEKQLELPPNLSQPVFEEKGIADVYIGEKKDLEEENSPETQFEDELQIEDENDEVDEMAEEKEVVFLSLKDDFYRENMFAFFRKLGPLQISQRDTQKESLVKEEAFQFFKNSGYKLMKLRNWKRPEFGEVEVDDDYVRRRVSDDIRRRLDQKSSWDDGIDKSVESSSKSPLVAALVPKKKNLPTPLNGNGGVKTAPSKILLRKPIVEEAMPKTIQKVRLQQSAPEQQAPIVRRHQPQPAQRNLILSQHVLQKTPDVAQPIAYQPALQVHPSQLDGLRNYHQPGVQQNQTQQPQTNWLAPAVHGQRVPTAQTSTFTEVPLMHQATSFPQNQSSLNLSSKDISPEDLTMHDVVLGSSVRVHTGNKIFHEMATKKMGMYQNARTIDKHGIAMDVVNEWRSLDPPGRFLRLNTVRDRDGNNRNYYVEGGDKRAVEKTKKILRGKKCTPTKTGDMENGTSLSRSQEDSLNPNDVFADSAQIAEEQLRNETESQQATPLLKQGQMAQTKERNWFQTILKFVMTAAIILCVVLVSVPANHRDLGFQRLHIPAVVVLTLSQAILVTMAYSSFSLTSSTISSRRQVKLFSKVIRLQASVLILLSVLLYYFQPERVMAMLLTPPAILLTLSPILLFATFSTAMVVAHESPHHHIEGGLLKNFVENSIRCRKKASTSGATESMPTLRDYLTAPEGFHMAFAPAFFGFFAYFGALAALEEGTGGLIVPRIRESDDDYESCLGLRSVSGASAGAMAATLLACGIDPSVAAEFTSKFTWNMVSDPPGWGGYVKGDKFEEAMVNFLLKEACKAKRRDVASETPFQFEDALIPCAVSGFDLLRMKGVILSSGSLAKAARASAGFPGLFQPVAWRENSSGSNLLPDSLLIDGGIRDGFGLAGLGAIPGVKERVVNMVVGDFGFSGPRGLHNLPSGVKASSLVSIAITGTPTCGPWAMENGKLAVESAKKAMMMALDKPMEKGDGENHYVLSLDASKFLD